MADAILNVERVINVEALSDALKKHHAGITGISANGSRLDGRLMAVKQVTVHSTEPLKAAEQLELLNILRAHDEGALTDAQAYDEAKESARAEAQETLSDLLNTLSEHIAQWQNLEDVKRDLALWLPAVIELTQAE